VLAEVERIRRFALVILVILSGTAAADPAAEAAFERGREMLKIGKYAAACDAFEESQRLEPRLDTQFNIALCSEQLGKLATALALHRELAQTLDTPTRRAKSAELAAQLEPRVPRLHTVVGEARKRTRRAPPGLEVRVNGVRITNFDDLPIDLGMNRITAIAPGFLDWSGQVSAAEEAKLITIPIDLQRDPEATPGEGSTELPGGDDKPPIVTPAGSNRKAYAAITLAMGGLALGGGVTFGLLARASWKDALDACGGDSACDETQLPIGERLRDKARSRGNVATVLSIAGGVAVVAGVVLYVTAPSEGKGVAIAPSADASSAGVVMFGRF
jgi:hypothetical protein